MDNASDNILDMVLFYEKKSEDVPPTITTEVSQVRPPNFVHSY